MAERSKVNMDKPGRSVIVLGRNDSDALIAFAGEVSRIKLGALTPGFLEDTNAHRRNRAFVYKSRRI